jgi:DNA replication protein DnaC
VSRSKIIADLVRADARELKMPGVARNFEALARQAGTEGWSPIEYLHEVLATEVASRAESAVRARLRNARFPEQKALGEFDFDVAAGVERTRLAELAGGAFIERGDNVIFAGPIGTGKTHLAIALGVEAATQRRHVAFYRAADLVSALREARDNRALGRLHRRTRRVELLILDEVGFVPFDRTGGELLFNLLADRYQARRSVVVTTNLSFAEWPKVFGGDEKRQIGSDAAIALRQLGDHRRPQLVIDQQAVDEDDDRPGARVARRLLRGSPQHDVGES